MSTNIFYIGMDLGSFKTSVASSTGVRDELHSAVGWPKDHYAQDMFGSEVVFGKDLIEHRLALEVVRPFEKGVFKYNSVKECGLNPDDVKKHREAARLLVDHAVALARPSEGLPVYGVIGAPSKASVANKQVILEAAQGAFDAVVIVPEPFALAYSMSRRSDALVIDIGAGTIDLCPIYGSFPSKEEQVTIPVGGDFIDENFSERLRTLYPDAQFSRNMAREIKEKYGFVHEVNEKIIVLLPVDGMPTNLDVTAPLKEACLTIVEPIVRNYRTVMKYLPPERWLGWSSLPTAAMAKLLWALAQHVRLKGLTRTQRGPKKPPQQNQSMTRNTITIQRPDCSRSYNKKTHVERAGIYIPGSKEAPGGRQ